MPKGVEGIVTKPVFAAACGAGALGPEQPRNIRPYLPPSPPGAREATGSCLPAGLLAQRASRGGWESAFLTSSQVLLALLVRGPT